MFQIFILYKIKLRNKCRFYQSFFSISSIRNCYLLYIFKEVITFLITCAMLFLFYKNIDNIGINKNVVYIILFVLLFIQQLGYNKTTKNYIQTNFDLYRHSSVTYFEFLTKTVLCHCVTDLCFKLTSMLPVIIFSCVWSLDSVIVVILGLILGFVVRVNETIYNLTKDMDNKFKVIVSFMKITFGLLMFFVIFVVGFRLVSTTLFIVKVLLTSSTYEETLLLNDLLMTFMDSVKWIKVILIDYLLVFTIYFAILAIAPFVFNIIQYKYLWENKIVSYYNYCISMPDDVLSRKGLPFLKMIYKQKLNFAYIQLLKQPEILVFLIIECVILYNIRDEMSKFFLIIWFFFIGNSNYIRSLFITGFECFGKYLDNVDLYYYRLTNDCFRGIYYEKFGLLKLYTANITLYQCLVACIFSLIFLPRWELKLFSILLIIFLKKPMQLFNCRLVSFSSFFVFANSCKSKLRTSEIDESGMVEDKMQNIFKLPFIIIPMVIIVLNYIYSFLNIWITLVVIILLFLFAVFLYKQIGQCLEKAGDILEKINVPD